MNIFEEIYKNDYKKFDHIVSKKGKKSIYQQVLYPLLKSHIKLKFEKPSAEIVRDRLQKCFDVLFSVADAMQTVLDQDRANVKLIHILCVPFDPLHFLMDYKPLLNYCLSAVQTIKRLLKKAGIDEVEAERLWSNPKENLVKQQNDLLIAIGQSLLQLPSHETLQVGLV